MMARRLLLQFISILLLVCWATCCRRLEVQWLKEEMTKEWHLFPEYVNEYFHLASNEKQYTNLKKDIWTYLVTLKKELLEKQREIDEQEREEERKNKEDVELFKELYRFTKPSFYLSLRHLNSAYAKHLKAKWEATQRQRERERQRKRERDRQRELDSIREREGLP
ncbi:putative uncharacterized protein DDB_G0271982 isoform X2 [Biomphalaria glabrata]|uniref:Uncharacterized protein n=1 Tax=Biomphalaria glabrata TaxID=6526 RepID=A0A9W3AXD3_BIOGL|nr:putative uncharacterized protein DDB_G0271982 isoform X2 [Biomphalaria glabrata]